MAAPMGPTRPVDMLVVELQEGSTIAGYSTASTSQRTSTRQRSLPGGTVARSQGADGSWSTAQPETESDASTTAPFFPTTYGGETRSRGVLARSRNSSVFPTRRRPAVPASDTSYV